MNSVSRDREPVSSFIPPGWLVIASVLGVVAGVVCLILGFALGPSIDAWLWLIVWFLIFLGIAQGMLSWAAIFRVSQTGWAPAVNRIGHSTIGFMSVVYLALIALLAGATHYMPWAEHPIPGKGAWLNLPFLAVRDFLGLAVLIVVDFFLVRWTLVADARARSGERVTSREQWRLTAIGTAIILIYVGVATIIAYDYVMSLSPEWVSTMFAPYYWITNLYAAMAVMIIIAALGRRALGAERFLQPQQFQDMGNLMLGFGLFSMGLFFAQYLTIWYENLPWETHFLLIRYYRGPWPWLGWAAFILEFAIPFIILQSRTLKRRAGWIMPVAVMALIGFMLERYVLVVPSLQSGRLWLYPLAGFGGLAFLGLFILAVVAFFMRYSPVSSAEAELPEVDLLKELER